MRDGILEALPQSLKDGQCVLLLGPKDSPGLNDVKGLVDDLNRNGEWIRVRFKDQGIVEIGPKMVLVLTMNALNGGTLTSVRREARLKGVPYLHQALTCGETKAILRTLGERRQNGTNGAHKSAVGAVATNTVQLHTTTELPRETDAQSHPAVGEISGPPAETPKSAIDVIEAFKNSLEEVQYAVLDAAEEASRERKSHAETKALLLARDLELQSIKTELEQVKTALHADREKLTALTEEKGKLDEEVHRLRTIFSSFQQTLKGVE
ncbi:MAG: hypothetical protein A2836_01770 [Candidatus Taylorbacteria bacterium RIFCSPHIGHO2_01_FULL_45_63]|uniref:Uncharacterized protein n=1 Tax=Candidatus Taylorbacteria bacterium RIFCSPHIGHO2_02_FULL_45_35 TaxID=1802311 RepID=A0A1G2MR26_9BACT|nr:MAG: hypothetical protein A2836_01770 [Candidatus Taylorbacteria bacterium RIFCSPHIGHO2_01_FULL_45_63]OHA26350.1 MAG: hypothetical protein A3D56_03675 [Candidatus Taylorbacteria bacterium RIFCSPHIGHO2_02_FULL_45_35]OHA32795.1 MAG: hypothetical protein A3A22_02530 [Candidatus Taylorbacteria bacterium RIFCSPLOWO2_01_FULL_45_34b]